MIPVPGRFEQRDIVGGDPRVADLFPGLMFGPGLDGKAHAGDVLSGRESRGYLIILESQRVAS
jgi:hypothetical protein